MATAFAVFCATDGSLTFYNRDSVPTAGSEFEGKIASNVYTGFGNTSYDSLNRQPWYSQMQSIQKVSFTSELKTFKPTNLDQWFEGATNMTTFDGTNLDTSDVTSMNGMFYYCPKLTSINLSNFNTSNVTAMAAMFYGCSALTSLDLSSFDVSNVIYMQEMFYDCSALVSLDLSNFNASKVQTMDSMFCGCSELTTLNLNGFRASSVTIMTGMFYYCSKLTSLDLSSFDTSNVTTMSHMFNSCSSLTTVNLSSFNTTNVTSMIAMFYECNNLESLDLSSFNISNVTYLAAMFDGCINLSTIYVSNQWSVNPAATSKNMFNSCTSLVGAVPYDSTKTDAAMANFITGYLTEKIIQMLINDTTLYNIADKIRILTGTTNTMTPSEMIATLDNVELGVDTTDATATPDQVAAGATYYAGGEKKEGTVYTIGSNLDGFGELTASDDRITLATSFDEPTLFPSGTKHNVKAYLNKFGDATATDVANGKTFTSKAGLMVVGSHVCPTVADLTADADASAGDIASGKTAYVDGVKVTGTLVPAEGKFSKSTGSATWSKDGTISIPAAKNCIVYAYCTSESITMPIIALINNGSLTILYNGASFISATITLSGTTLKCSRTSSGSYTYAYEVYKVV